jgi:hypothetical protein
MEHWNLVNRDPKVIGSRAKHILANDSKRRRFVHDLIAALPATASPSAGWNGVDDQALYDQLWGVTAHPAVRMTGARSFEPQVGLAAALAYQTVVVPDPMFTPSFLFTLAKASRDKVMPDFEPALMESFLNLYFQEDLPNMIALADAGIVTFDLLWGRGSAATGKDKRVIGQLKRELGWEVVMEALWATMRAKRFGASVGTGEANFGRILRTWEASRGPRTSSRAVEVDVLVPYVGNLTVPQLINLRTKHEDKLAQFRAALASATQALRDLPADDVTNSRARDVVGDYLDGELSKLHREWNAVRLFRYGSLAAATLTAGSTAMALGVQGPAPATQLLPLLTGSLSVASAAAALGLDETRLQANNLYVLWEAARKGKSHRAIGARGHGG